VKPLSRALKSIKAAPEIRARPFDRVTDHPSRIENVLSNREQQELRSIATVLDYGRGGAIIFTEGAEARFVYAIDEGIVRISRHASNGQRQILAFMVPGDLFGIPDDGIYVNTAEVICPARIYRFGWQRLSEVMTREPQLQQHLLMKVAHDLRQAQRQIMILGHQTTHQRLATFLLEFLHYPEFYDEKNSCLILPISRFDLADYLGIARETLARAFTKLEYDGLVRRLDFRAIQILDVVGLRSLKSSEARR